MLVSGLVTGCDGLPCRTNNQCPVGMYCRIEREQCDYDCLQASDCPEPAAPGRRAICTNEGRCAQAGRPPRLLVEQPAQDQTFPFSAREITVAGRVVVETPTVEISVTTRGRAGCVAESLRQVRLDNPNPGVPTELPFTLDDVVLDPGETTVEVVARAGVAEQTNPVDVERACVGCPEVTVAEPSSAAVLAARFIPRLVGRIEPAPPAGARWRVTDEQGQVFDGALPLVPDGTAATFRVLQVPTFAGRNRLDVLVPVSGGFEGSCSTAVLAPATEPRSARAVLTWDTDGSDLDLVFVGSGASLGIPGGVVSPRRRDDQIPARVQDDFDGRGPELLFAAPLTDGAYGIVVEAQADGAALGSSALVRVLYEDRLLLERPAGPQFLSAARGELWVVGALHIENGAGRFVAVDEVITSDQLPIRPPRDWPALW